MEQITLTVPDLTCGHRKQSIEGTLAELGGVDCAVRLEQKQVEGRPRA